MAKSFSHRSKGKSDSRSGHRHHPPKSFGAKDARVNSKDSYGGKGPLFPKGLRPVVGTHAIKEALSVHGSNVEFAWIEDNFQSSKELRELESQFQERKIKTEVKPSALLEKLAKSHQGAAVFLNKAPAVDWPSICEKESSMVLFVDGVEDPHNLGAIIRTSWLLGVDAIVVPEDRAVGLTATVHKVACGGAEHVPIETCNNFSNILETLKKNGFWVYGLSHLGKTEIFDLNLSKKVVWMVGSEEKGLRITSERQCDELVRIPQASAAASYNASVAAAIALTESFRQTRQ